MQTLFSSQTPPSVKWTFALAIVVMMLLVWLFLDKRVDKGHLWAFGKRDGVRLLFYTEEGVLRPNSKRNILIYLGCCLLLVLLFM